MGKVASGQKIRRVYGVKFAGFLDGSLCGANSAYFAGSALSFHCDSRKAFRAAVWEICAANLRIKRV
ncbi:hypothetical protein [Campylobacter rectus]|uniref:hypothetical protein n=1 Tax=Campylobacter rectus TaxID=203 RepID=UPI0028E9F504|nr:hypothetical protein [Campylobacter rectus]